MPRPETIARKRVRQATETRALAEALLKLARLRQRATIPALASTSGVMPHRAKALLPDAYQLLASRTG
jgi:hypothetical protein